MLRCAALRCAVLRCAVLLCADLQVATMPTDVLCSHAALSNVVSSNRAVLFEAGRRLSLPVFSLAACFCPCSPALQAGVRCVLMRLAD